MPVYDLEGNLISDGDEETKLIHLDTYVKDARPTEWVVEDHIAARATTIIAGRAKTARKSLQVMHLVECVAQGIPWLGMPVRKRQTVFTGFEGGRAFLGQRFLEIGHTVSLDGEAMAPMYYAADGIGGYREVLARLREASASKTPWPILWCVDTLSQVLAREGLDENDNMAITNYLAEIDEVAIGSEAAILFVHHFSKQGMQMRGASAMNAVVNWCEINAIKGQDGILRMDWTLRHGPNSSNGVRVHKPNGRFHFEPIDLADLPKEDSHGREEKARTVILEVLMARCPEDVPAKELQDVVQKATGGRAYGLKALTALMNRIAQARPGTIAPSMGAGEPGWHWRGESK